MYESISKMLKRIKPDGKSNSIDLDATGLYLRAVPAQVVDQVEHRSAFAAAWIAAPDGAGVGVNSGADRG